MLTPETRIAPPDWAVPLCSEPCRVTTGTTLVSGDVDMMISFLLGRGHGRCARADTNVVAQQADSLNLGLHDVARPESGKRRDVTEEGNRAVGPSRQCARGNCGRNRGSCVAQ